MKKNNYVLLTICLLTLGSCTGEKTFHSLASAYQAKYLIEEKFEEVALDRKVASDELYKMCFESRFNIETLKKEVADYEKKVIGLPVQGFWKHLDLESLPVPQATFLKKYGESIGDLANPNTINYEGCSSLPCIFNRIYERDESDIAGYVHYIWYLKFGNYLSLDNSVPEQKSSEPGVYKSKNYKLADYLYNNDELYGLWRVTHMLQDPFTNLSNLKEIQRIPRTAIFEDYDSSVCGLAYYEGESIRLTDGCLKIDDYDIITRRLDRHKGHLYTGVIHEITHMLDYSQGSKKNRWHYSRSDQNEFQLIKSYIKTEYTSADGKTTSLWNPKTLTGNLREHAKSNPHEAFAEDIAVFRTKGENAINTFDPKYFKWISDNFYHGESYDLAGNMRQYFKKYEPLFIKDLPSIIMECSSTKNNFQSNYFSHSDLSQTKISPKMLKCLSYEVEALSKKMTAHIRLYDPDGCQVTIPAPYQDDPWASAIKQSLKKHLSVHIQAITDDPKYFSKVKDFNLILNNRSMANQAILECYNGSTLDNLSSCYEEKTLTKSKVEALKFRFTEKQALEMAKLYLSAQPYVNVIEDLYQSYKTILNAHDSLIERESEDLWKMCLKNNNKDDLKPTGSLFTPKSGYLVSSIYNCLNEQLPSTLNNIIRTVSYEGQKITNPSEEKIMLEFLAPKVNEYLYTMLGTSTSEEKKELTTKIAGIRSQLLADLSWATSANDNRVIEQSCKAQALTHINYLPLFHLKNEIFSELIMSGPCHDIMSEPVFKSKFEIKKKKFKLNPFR